MTSFVYMIRVYDARNILPPSPGNCACSILGHIIDGCGALHSSVNNYMPESENFNTYLKQFLF